MCVELCSLPHVWRLHLHLGGKSSLSLSRFALHEMHVLCTFPRPWGPGVAFPETVGGLCSHTSAD